MSPAHKLVQQKLASEFQRQVHNFYHSIVQKTPRHCSAYTSGFKNHSDIICLRSLFPQQKQFKAWQFPLSFPTYSTVLVAQDRRKFPK